MGIFSKLFKGPEIDMEKSSANAKRMRALFDHVVEGGNNYRLIFGYTEDVSRFNYGFVHGSKTKIGNLIVGWNEAEETIVAVPTVPDLSGCGDPTYYRRADILKAYRNKYPTDAFVIYPDKRGYIAINAYDWLEDESLYVYVPSSFALNCRLVYWYLGYIADAATALLMGKADGSGGQWRDFPWPARRKLGFTL